MQNLLREIPPGLDFVLGPAQFSKPDWADKHRFIPSSEKPEVCGYEESSIKCKWPADSTFHQ